MGTHNRLLGLGDLYLEVIAVDPGAPDARPGRAGSTWTASPGAPRADELDRGLRRSRRRGGAGPGRHRRAHGAVARRPALADGRAGDGRLPFDDAFPALIQWEGTAHPAGRLPDPGVRLTRLEIAHPEAAALRAALAGRFADPRVVIVQGSVKAMRATFDTPRGTRTL